MRGAHVKTRVLFIKQDYKMPRKKEVSSPQQESSQRSEKLHSKSESDSKKKESISEEAEKTAEKAIKKSAKKIKKLSEEQTQESIKEPIEKPKKDKSKLAELLKKAKELEETLEEAKEIDFEKKVIGEEEKQNLLVPLADYMKSSIHLGTRVITPDTRDFVYRRRSDGLAIFNTSKIDEKIREGADYLAQFSPDKILLVCKREAGWPAAQKFSEMTGIKAFTKKYPAGILTNSNLSSFLEADIVLIIDPWLDKNALHDAQKMRMSVIAVCDTNNYTRGIDKIILGNNKSYKSIGMVLYLLAKIYKQKRNLEIPEPQIQEFVQDWDNVQPVQ